MAVRKPPVLVLALLVLMMGWLPASSGVADEGRPGELLAGEWVADAAVTAAEATGAYTFRAEFPANALMVHWAREPASENAMVEVSVSQNGRSWTPWQLAPTDEDSDGPAPADRRYTGAFMVAPSRHVRVRALDAVGQPGPTLPDLRVTYLNTLAGPETDSLEALAKKKTPTPLPPVPTPIAATTPAAPAAGISIIARSDWGANESLRFRNGKERWPRAYQAPEKIVLHHTETPNDQDPMAAIRAVYYFHTVTRGWGDIGYNYLVDQTGRIYEGRAGGEHVIGGHALRYNRGSLGIAVLGSFQSASISQRAEDAIVRLIAAKGRFIDPIGQGYFVDKVLPNIAGHRDCLSTACPGNAFYPRLPAIRDRVLQQIGFRPRVDVRVTDVQIAPTALHTGDALEVRATITNVGTAIVPSDARGPGISYDEGQTYDQRGLPKVTGRFRLGLEGVGAGGAAYPYRWGLGKPLLPGESVTITGAVRVLNPQQRVFRVALVEEYVRYWQQEVSPTLVVVTGPPAVPAPVAPVPPPVEPDPVGPLPTDRQMPPGAPDPERTYYPETGHFLGQGFRHYWERHGGLAQFGYPITTEFTELNPADGKEYTVQYFERARFEYHPEHKGTPYEVLLGHLGRQVTTGRTFPTAAPGSPAPRAGARYFPETRQWVSGPLLKHWTDTGGLMTYGYPISPEFEEINPDDGRPYMVQYFERNRLEVHPEFAGTPNGVLLGLLGRQVLVERNWLTR